MLTSFLLFLLFFVIVGISSLRRRRKTTIDYLLAEHNIKPWLAGLSAVATNNSGYMFIGLIGYTYVAGLSSIWLMVGWILGDLAASFFVHKKLREKTESCNAHTYSGTLAKWTGVEFHNYRRLSGLISIIFLGAYAAAQFNAGSKALSVLFGWAPSSGAIIGAVIVLLYCFSGGIRASIWTDAAQSFVMMVSIILLLTVAVAGLGGWSLTIEKLNLVEPGYMDLFPKDLPAGPVFGPILFVFGWFFAGIGVAGQPHIMVRFMSLDKPSHITRARVYYYLWFTAFYGFANTVGLLARLYIPESANFDAELALPTIADSLLPDVLVGVILAGIFAATISTADSLILSCSASVTHDLSKKKSVSYFITKLATVGVTAIALCIALFGEKSVFELVILSWAVLSSAFIPLLAAYIFGWDVTEKGALFLTIVSLAIMFLWRYLGLSSQIYEIAPAVIGSLSLYRIVLLFKRQYNFK